MNAEAGKSWKLFVGVLVCVLAVKMLLSAILPITSDEAYFCIWAGYPDFGYYDHPPMAGWLLSLLLPFGRSLLMVRLMSLLLTFVIGSGIYLLMRGRDEERAGLVAALSSLFVLLAYCFNTQNPKIMPSILFARNSRNLFHFFIQFLTLSIVSFCFSMPVS